MIKFVPNLFKKYILSVENLKWLVHRLLVFKVVKKRLDIFVGFWLVPFWSIPLRQLRTVVLTVLRFFTTVNHGLHLLQESWIGLRPHWFFRTSRLAHLFHVKFHLCSRSPPLSITQLSVRSVRRCGAFKGREKMWAFLLALAVAGLLSSLWSLTRF